MIVFLDGQFVPEKEARVSIFDRGFLYGDGLFETLRIYGGKPFRWEDHLERLSRGAEFLKIAVSFSSDALREKCNELIERNKMPDSVLRLTLTRGIGERGYSPKGADKPTLAMTLHPAPPEIPPGEGWRVFTSSIRLSKDDPLAQFKTCNKLPQILARMEASNHDADEALLLNDAGEPVEASAANLFWIRDGIVCTPPLTNGVMAGVTRKVVLEICARMGLVAREGGVTLAGLRRVEGIFLTQSSRGIVEVSALDGEAVSRSEVIRRLQAAYLDSVATP